MQIKDKQPKPYKKIIIVATSLIVVVTCIVVGLYIINMSNSGNQDSVNPKQQNIDNQNKKNIIESNRTDQQNGNSLNNVDLSNDKNIVLMATQETNNTVTVTTKLYKYSDGICNLAVTNGGRNITQSAPVIFQPEYSSCAGFSVNISTLGTGTWKVGLEVISKNQTAKQSIQVDIK